jgi:hypothetical protein
MVLDTGLLCEDSLPWGLWAANKRSRTACGPSTIQQYTVVGTHRKIGRKAGQIGQSVLTLSQFATAVIFHHVLPIPVS